MIARKSVLIILTNILNAIFGYITLYFISRYMSAYEFGVVGFALGFVHLFQFLGDMGFNQAHIKKISEGKNLGKCIGTFFVARIGFVCLMISAVISSIFIWKIIINQGFESTTHEYAVYIILLYCSLAVFSNTMLITFKAKKEIVKLQIPLVIEVFLRALATIYVAIGNYGALALASTYIVGWAGNFLFSLYFFKGYPIEKPNLNYIKDYSKFAFPLVFVMVCSTVITSIDKVLIQLFFRADQVGYYMGAYRFVASINMFTVAVGTLLFPTFSELHVNKNLEAIHLLIFKSERYLSMIIFPMVFGMLALAEPVVFILLHDWQPTIPILQILLIFVLFAALERPYQSQFLGANKPKIVRNRIFIMVILNIILNLIFIPEDINSLGIKLLGLGARGAALATAISYGVGFTYSRIMAYKITKIKGNYRIVFHAFAAVIMSVFLYLINKTIVINRWYYLVFFSLMGLVLYISILIIFKEFSKQDFKFFIDLLNIKKMIDYIKKEVKRK